MIDQERNFEAENAFIGNLLLMPLATQMTVAALRSE